VPKHTVILDSAGVTSYELSSLTDKARADQGALSFLVLANIDPTWQAAKGMWVLLPSLVLVKWHWASSLTAQGLGQGTRDAKFYLALTHKSSKHQHACAGSTRQRMNGGRGSGPYPATVRAAGLIPPFQAAKVETGLWMFPWWDSSDTTLCPH